MGEMGCDLWFCRSGGLAPEVLVFGVKGMTWGFSGMGVQRVSGGGGGVV